MKVFIYRHTDAEAGGPDEDRILSDNGREQVRNLARFVPEAEFNEISEIWHSTLVRSRQTMELFKEHVALFHNIELHSLAELEPDANVTDMGKLLADCEGDVIICGHNPFLEELVTALCSGEPGMGLVNLKKGGMICMERTSEGSVYLPMGFWTIDWYLMPRLVPCDTQSQIGRSPGGVQD